MPATDRTFEITDERGTRRITLAQFRAELDARQAAAMPIMDAFRRGDLKACGEAQAAMRAQFGVAS